MMTVLRGGPVETSRGFVLHATDKRREYGSVAVSDDVRLSASIEILQAIAKGEGPNGPFLTVQEIDGKIRSLSTKKIVSR